MTSQDRVQMRPGLSYPKNVVYQNSKFLNLADNKLNTRHLLVAITKDQYDHIYAFGKGLPVNVELKEKSGILCGKRNGIRCFKLEDTYIALEDILIWGSAARVSESKEKFMRCRQRHDTGRLTDKYWFNYGSQKFDYYGAGLETSQAAWKTICQLTGATEYFIIYQAPNMETLGLKSHRHYASNHSSKLYKKI